MTQKKVLIVDEDKIIRDSLCDFLTRQGLNTTGTGTLQAALNALRKENYNVVLSDVKLPDSDGFKLLEIIKKDYPQTVPIVITAYGTIEGAVKAIKNGAFEYLTKPIIDDELTLTLERAIKQQSLMSENEQLRHQLEKKYSLENILSQDYKMARIFDLVEAVAESTTTVLMTGPSGTGKSMLARAIHHRSSRRTKPFVEVSCGALPEALLESELFGHVKGAFTGAVETKEGKFLAADGGTIFLDEISSASPALQVKLLRVLQERQFEPVGSNKTINVDTRIVLASNKDLAEEVRHGRFREDLFYRINVVPILMPPLRERLGDIQLLAERFLKIYCAQHNRHKAGITEETIEYLERYPWPGNVRELENVIERAVLLSKGNVITPDDLPVSLIQNTAKKAQTANTTLSLKEALAEPEKEIITQTLKANQWNRQKTAAVLQIERTTLFKKMKKYKIYEEIENF